MKKIAQIITALLLSAGFATAAVAAVSVEPPQYGFANEAAKSTNNPMSSHYVYLNNKTYDEYNVDAYYPLSGVHFYDYLGPYQSAYMTLRYTVTDPDSVCFTLTRLGDYASWYYGCFVSGNWNVTYRMLSKTQSLNKNQQTSEKPVISKS